MAAEEREGWSNVYYAPASFSSTLVQPVSSCTHDSRAHAEELAAPEPVLVRARKVACVSGMVSSSLGGAEIALPPPRCIRLVTALRPLRHGHRPFLTPCAPLPAAPRLHASAWVCRPAPPWSLTLVVGPLWCLFTGHNGGDGGVLW